MRRASVLVVPLLLVALSGCMVQDTADPPTDDPAPAGDLRFTEIALPEPARAGEPNVVVAPDGVTVYVVAPSYDQMPAALLWRSDDGGRNWTALGPVAEEWGTNDAHLAVRPDGSVWLATFWGKPGSYCTTVGVSKDKGGTWSLNPYACGTPTGDERPWLAAGVDKTYLLHWWMAKVNGPEGRLVYRPIDVALSVTEDNQAWFSLPTRTDALADASPLDYEEGLLAFAWSTVPFGGNSPYYVSTSEDDGLTWTTEILADERVDHVMPQFALDGQAGIAAWGQMDEEDGSDIRMALRDKGNWGEATTLDGAGNNLKAWAAAKDGHRVVAWLHTEEGGDAHLVSDNATWTLRLWLDGRVYDVPGAVHTGPLSCFGCEAERPEGARYLGDYISVDLLPGGMPIVTYAKDAEPGSGFFAAPVHVVVASPA